VTETSPSYRALFRIPGIPRLIASMLLARIAGQMTSLILVLFALDRYGSPAVAGAATFLAVFPGLVGSPIAGAPLALIAVLALLDALPVPLLLLIVTVTSLTFPLSATGVRTLFPILVPQPLWERANAIDSNGYVVSSIFGPALAGALVALFGAPVALLVTAALAAGAAIIALGLRDPSTRTESRALLPEAWRGLVYVARHPSLRSLAISISIANIGWGLFFIALPVLVLRRIGGDAASVGNLFALLGVTGSVAVLFMGRISTRGREHLFLAGAMLGQAVAFAICLFAGGDWRLVALAMLVLGVATGPFDVTLFTVRQRRTDPAWMGRAFAVSMSLNFIGFPIGSAIGGVLVPISLEAALAAAIVANVIAALLAQRLPREG
jgi:predicted MFS family arabinose efflux permease